MTGTAVYIDPLSDEYRSVIEARGVQLQQLQQMPAMLHAVRLDITRYELLDGALRSRGLRRAAGARSGLMYSIPSAILWLGSTRSETGHRGR